MILSRYPHNSTGRRFEKKMKVLLLSILLPRALASESKGKARLTLGEMHRPRSMPSSRITDFPKDLTRNLREKNGKVDICHFPPGNPFNFETLSVAANAVSAHLKNHNDLEGSCADNCSRICLGEDSPLRELEFSTAECFEKCAIQELQQR